MVEQTDEEFIAEIAALAGNARAAPAAFTAAAPHIPRLLEIIERLSGVIERDRTKTAESIARLRAIVAGRSWLGEGRGNLAWDDDQYQEEFRGMIEEFMAALDPLKVLAADWSDCPKDFQAARIDWKAQAEAAEAAQREAIAEVARLREALETAREYFDNHADADCDQDGFIPNAEMRIVAEIDSALTPKE